MGTITSCDLLSDVAALSADTPVVCQLNPLEKRILETCYGRSICPDIKTFWQAFESPSESFDRPVIIDDVTDVPDLDTSLTTYTPPTNLPILEYTGDVYDQSLNEYTSNGNLSWADVQEATLCQSEISDKLVTLAEGYDVVALVIVDGLSYIDWTSYGGNARPVYVDAPTITECGYPNVVQPPTQPYNIATRLHKEGFQTKRAYTYWEKKHNDLTERLHKPFSPNEVKGDVESFNDVTRDLRRRTVIDSTYIQITLTGPERVAHQIKEDPYVEDQVNQVKTKLTELDEILSDQVENHLILATADHGLLWRMNTEFTVIDGEYEHTDRRQLTGTAANKSLPRDKGRSERYNGTHYHRLYHPYLFHSLRSNEPGVHGGYSCEECIVPLITVEG